MVAHAHSTEENAPASSRCTRPLVDPPADSPDPGTRCTSRSPGPRTSAAYGTKTRWADSQPRELQQEVKRNSSSSPQKHRCLLPHNDRYNVSSNDRYNAPSRLNHPRARRPRHRWQRPPTRECRMPSPLDAVAHRKRAHSQDKEPCMSSVERQAAGWQSEAVQATCGRQTNWDWLKAALGELEEQALGQPHGSGCRPDG
jgi:hypothetical protein